MTIIERFIWGTDYAQMKHRHNPLDYDCKFWVGDMRPEPDDRRNRDLWGLSALMADRRCLVCRPFTAQEEAELLDDLLAECGGLPKPHSSAAGLVQTLGPSSFSPQPKPTAAKKGGPMIKDWLRTIKDWLKRPAEEPRGVRIQHADGTVTPVSLVYDGKRDGCHVWIADPFLEPTKARAGDYLLVDSLPGRTAIDISFTPSEP